jgi:hypothetical protein
MVALYTCWLFFFHCSVLITVYEAIEWVCARFGSLSEFYWGSSFISCYICVEKILLIENMTEQEQKMNSRSEYPYFPRGSLWIYTLYLLRLGVHLLEIQICNCINVSWAWWPNIQAPSIRNAMSRSSAFKWLLREAGPDFVFRGMHTTWIKYPHSKWRGLYFPLALLYLSDEFNFVLYDT